MESLFRTIHYIGLNFVSAERLDPLIYGFLSLIGLAQSQFFYVGAEVLILSAGVALLLSVTRSKGSLLVGVWAGMTILLLLGLEPFYLKFHWFPWMLAAFVLLLLQPRAVSFALGVIFVALWIFSAGTLAPTGIFIAAIAALAITLRMRSFTRVIAEGGRSYTAFSVLVGIAGLFAVAALPEYPMPEYPSDAKLTVDNFFELLPFPLLGGRLHPVPLVEPVFFGLLALYLQNYLLLLCSAGIGVAIAALLWDERIERAWLRLSLHAAFALVVVGSLLFWEPRYIGLHPFVLLMRITPGLGHAFLPWLLLPFSVLLVSIGLFAHCSRRHILLVLCSTGAMGFGLWLTGSIPPSQAHFVEFGVESERSPYVGVTWSPSAAVVATMGPWVANPESSKRRDFAAMRRLRVEEDYRIARSTAGPADIASARGYDGNVFTSWGTGRAQRRGDYYELEFESEVKLARVVLSIQETPENYPCGLVVRAKDRRGDQRELYRQDPWPGPLFWTEDGFPYFGQKRHVIVDFPNSYLVRSLRFELLSSSCGDRPWSIGELKLYDLQER